MLSWNGKPNGQFDRNQKPSCYQVKQIFSTWVTPKQYFLGNILAMEGISPIFSLSKTSNSISSLTARPTIDSNLSRAVFTYWVFSTAQWEQTRQESDALHTFNDFLIHFVYHKIWFLRMMGHGTPYLFPICDKYNPKVCPLCSFEKC